MRLLQGMIQDLALTRLISGRRGGALADDGGVLLIKAEQVAHRLLRLNANRNAQCSLTSDLYTHDLVAPPPFRRPLSVNKGSTGPIKTSGFPESLLQSCTLVRVPSTSVSFGVQLEADVAFK